MNLENMRAELIHTYEQEQTRIKALEQLIRDYRHFVREEDDRNGNVVIVHPYAMVDSLEKRATELIGE